VIEEIAAGPELPQVTLYLALIKFERFEWAVEKATELGVMRIVPIEANRSEQGLSAGAHKRVERWRRIAREASEQSRRLRAPDISDAIRFSAALNDSSTHRVWLDERPGAKPLLAAIDLRRGHSAAIMIGPEGGWVDGERERLAASNWIAASLGPSILRAETAVCAALGALLQMWMVSSDSFSATEPTGTIE
jgi:16S rRNA (uracil1498-N3)-methyltransferase